MTMTRRQGRWIGPLVVMMAVATGRTSAAQERAAAAASVIGEWHASIVSGGVEIPFRFDIAARGDALIGSFFNRRALSALQRAHVFSAVARLDGVGPDGEQEMTLMPALHCASTG